MTSRSSVFFLSLASTVFEPVELPSPQAWDRNNDVMCPQTNTSSCTVDLNISCVAWAIDYITAKPAPSPPEGAARNATVVTATPAPSASVTPLNETGSSATLTSVPTPAPTEVGTMECKRLDIANAGDRTGVYLFNETLTNDFPTYSITGLPGRIDQVFSVSMSACIFNWGLVNSTWVENRGALGLDATVRQVFLEYLAGLDFEVGPDGCSVDVWFIALGGVTNLGSALGDTFFAVSGEQDPSNVKSWVKFTPANATSRATIGTSSVVVVCDDNVDAGVMTQQFP